MNSVSNRLVFYKTVNPEVKVHDIFTKKISVSMQSNEYHGQNYVSVHTPSLKKEDAATGEERDASLWKKGYVPADLYKQKHMSLKAVLFPLE